MEPIVNGEHSYAVVYLNKDTLGDSHFVSLIKRFVVLFINI